MFKVTFSFEDGSVVEHFANAGDNLLELAREANVAIDAPCSGNASCGKCRVQLKKGELDSKKTLHISDEEYQEGWRLACTSKICADVTVLVPDIASAYKSRMKVADLSSKEEIAIFENSKRDVEMTGIELRNSLDVIELDMNEPSLDDTMPDNERLTRALKKYMNLKQVRIPYAVLRKLPDVLRENHFKVKCVVRTAPNDLFVYDIFGKDEEVVVGGLAVDIGTTTVSAVLLNMETGEILAKASSGNGQIRFSLEARGIKIKITKVDIPVAFASAFEGEIIRRKDMRVEFDGSRVDCVELVQTKEMNEVEDHKITVVGPEIDSFEPGSKHSLAYVVEVAGKKMQPDFEPVIERKFHNYINCIEGVYHTGQRDMFRIRISNDAFAAGFRAKHFGEVLYTQVKNEFEAVVDKCQVTVYTDPDECTRMRHEVAIPTFDKRDARLETLTDESVDVYYSCILCQAFSPSHVCVVTPERLGLCGAVSWLDAKATNELDPNGPCQIITKERPIDVNLGSYEDVDEAVKKYSQGALEHVTLYSIMQDPMTSCGCFECICGIEPFSNGVVIANREYAGMTPLGMTFSEMASMTGGGVQTPGFMGHGKHFISSKKFMKAEGGIERIVWMPKELKETVAERLNKTAKELYGIDNFTDMIGDETVATDPEVLVAFLTEHNHPALSMDPMM